VIKGYACYDLGRTFQIDGRGVFFHEVTRQDGAPPDLVATRRSTNAPTRKSMKPSIDQSYA
jgi:hypothetical protein